MGLTNFFTISKGVGGIILSYSVFFLLAINFRISSGSVVSGRIEGSLWRCKSFSEVSRAARNLLAVFLSLILKFAKMLLVAILSLPSFYLMSIFLHLYYIPNIYIYQLEACFSTTFKTGVPSFSHPTSRIVCVLKNSFSSFCSGVGECCCGLLIKNGLSDGIA